MMKRIYILIAVLPILFGGCGKAQHVELPPPPAGEETPGGGENPGDEPGGDEPGGGDGQTHPWDENRGKVVTPSGSQWTSSTVREGITYYHFSGTDAVSGAKQEAFAVDLDLNNPKYEVLMTRNSAAVASAIHAKYNAIATVNAGYEAGSIYVRSQGIDYSIIPNVQIGDTGQDNWKSEGAFFIDKNGAPGMVFLGSPKRNGVLKDIQGCTYAEAVKKQRAYYMSMSKEYYPYLLSSAPMMINDFEPLGETFCDYTITAAAAQKLNSEHLEHHQRVRHPRSAVALTENKHLILFVVDGRRTARQGMSCKELTDFMIKWFNPQWALNLDGGGSTTLCVEGLGDSREVVNSPIDGGVSGQERARDTHILIVEKQ